MQLWVRLRGLLLFSCLSLNITTTRATVLEPGYNLQTFFNGSATPASLAFGPDSTLYVGQLDSTVIAIRDLNHDGIADTSITFAAGMLNPTGLAFHQGRLFVSFSKQINAYTDTNGDYIADVVDSILTMPPTAGRNYGIAIGPDNLLYVGAAGTDNLGPQGHPWAGTILRCTTQGNSIEVFASGVRVAYGLAFNSNGELFVTDNGPSPESTMCFEAPDELNWIQQGANYGFPNCFGFGDCADVSSVCNPPPCGVGDCDFGGCDSTVAYPISLFDPHSSADGMAFGDSFEGFGPGDLFVAEFGQTVPAGGCNSDFGHQVSRVSVYEQNGQWFADPPIPFVTDLGRPLDVAVGPDHALYIADFETGDVLRVAKDETVSVPENRPNPHPFKLWPNPARQFTQVLWETPAPKNFVAAVFDAKGRVITSLNSQTNGMMRWDLKDTSSKRVAAGVYFLRITDEQGTHSRKIQVLP
ncbi:MAG: T9SS type A sorting domain-containing protein [Candidatus Eisenbacteria bacterium]|uniref:T9SS type A sorting domain-containing protein n=1 Tax=Eiseniibacteriota bacterium TaxID=2212470 RepID=A0A7Y2H1N9_UNCEI|nr:T9SS type A sorting domain-containing protein [Candidatus Eisenbacteria bacterium]